MQNSENSRLLNEKQAGEVLGLSTKTLQGWRTRPMGPAWYKIGRTVRYRLSDLEKFIENSIRTKPE